MIIEDIRGDRTYKYFVIAPTVVYYSFQTKKILLTHFPQDNVELDEDRNEIIMLDNERGVIIDVAYAASPMFVDMMNLIQHCVTDRKVEPQVTTDISRFFSGRNESGGETR